VGIPGFRLDAVASSVKKDGDKRGQQADHHGDGHPIDVKKERVSHCLCLLCVSTRLCHLAACGGWRMECFVMQREEMELLAVRATLWRMEIEILREIHRYRFAKRGRRFGSDVELTTKFELDQVPSHDASCRTNAISSRTLGG